MLTMHSANPNEKSKLAERTGMDKGSAVVLGDVLEDAQDGEILEFQPRRFVHSYEGPLALIENWGCLEGCFVALAFEDDEVLEVTGSGVIVAPGVVMCATHVIEDHLDALKAGQKRMKVLALGLENHQIWTALSVTPVTGTDLSLLTIQLTSALPGGSKFSTCAMTTRTPRSGEIVHVVGFRADGPAPMGSNVQISGGLILSTGKVTDVHTEKRDNFFLTWPCFGIECVTMGGMSGGPIFDANGYLIGLLCSSYDNQPISYASLLRNAFVTAGIGAWPPVEYLLGKPLLDRVNDGCLIERPDAFQVIDGQGYRFEVWN